MKKPITLWKKKTVLIKLKATYYTQKNPRKSEHPFNFIYNFDLYLNLSNQRYLNLRVKTSTINSNFSSSIASAISAFTSKHHASALAFFYIACVSTLALRILHKLLNTLSLDKTIEI